MPNGMSAFDESATEIELLGLIDDMIWDALGYEAPQNGMLLYSYCSSTFIVSISSSDVFSCVSG